MLNWNDVKNLEEVAKNDPTIRGKLVGMSFVLGYPQNLYNLFNKGGLSLPATITHNPHNAYDSNACEVYVGEVFIGHLARELAAEIAPRLKGEDYTMTLELLVTPGAESNPGVSFSLLFGGEYQ